MRGRRARTPVVPFLSGLDQVPEVSIQIFEDGDGAVGLFLGLADEFDLVCLEGVVVAPEVVGVEEEEDAASGLIADAGGLFGCGGAGEEEVGPGGAGRSNEDPALTGAHVGVFEEVEAEDVGVVGDGFVVVANDKGDVGEGLGHGEIVVVSESVFGRSSLRSAQGRLRTVVGKRPRGMQSWNATPLDSLRSLRAGSNLAKSERLGWGTRQIFPASLCSAPE